MGSKEPAWVQEEALANGLKVLMLQHAICQKLKTETVHTFEVKFVIDDANNIKFYGLSIVEGEIKHDA